MRCVACSLGVVLCTTLPSQSTWTQATPTSSPPMYRTGAMAFDATANRLLMHGGLTQTPGALVSDTWAYNGTWTLLNPVGGAPGRWGHQLVRNSLTNRLITFGGHTPDITPLGNDTWEWTGTAWTQIPTPTAPSARALYGMCFDRARGVVVLFGGRTNSQTLQDTWEYNGITWAQVVTAHQPPARAEMAMVQDESFGETVLFGGYVAETATVLGDTWVYDGVDWSQRTPAVAPTGRYRAAAEYDSVRRRAVLFGGYDGSVITRETYEWDGATWAPVTTAGGPPANATETYHGYDPVRRKFVVFGGFGGAFSNATWEFSGATTGLFSTFATGCTTAAVEPSLAGTTPTVGQTFGLTIGDVPADDDLVVVVVGLSITTWSGGALPAPLAAIGLPACELLVAPDLLDVTVAAGGNANWSLAIPSQPALVNQQVFVQGVLLDLLPVDFQFTATTRGGRLVIGS